MSEYLQTNDKLFSRRAFLKGAVGLFVLSAISACGGETGGTPEEAATEQQPTPTPENRGTAWDVNCTAQVEVEAGDVFGDVIDRAQDTCPNLSIHDAYKSFYMQNRSVNQIMAGETVTLNDYKNVP